MNGFYSKGDKSLKEKRKNELLLVRLGYCCVLSAVNEGPILSSAIIPASSADEDMDVPAWVKSSAKMLNGGIDGQDWLALAKKLGLSHLILRLCIGLPCFIKHDRRGRLILIFITQSMYRFHQKGTVNFKFAEYKPNGQSRAGCINGGLPQA